MTNKTHNECPKCGHETVAVQLYDDGSGKVYCKRTNCGFKHTFLPQEEPR